MSEGELRNHLLVIGGSSLVGRRLRPLSDRYNGKVSFTGAKHPADGDLYLDALSPGAFSCPDVSDVIACIPIKLIGDDLLSRLRALGMKRLIVFSSTSLLTKTQTADPYEQEMVAALQESEARVRNHCDAHNVRWTIFRPTLIYDEGFDRNVTQIWKVIRHLGFFPVAGAARGLRRPVHAEDLAIASLQALHCPAAFGSTYALSGGETLTYKQMIQRIFEGMNRRPVIVPLPLAGWRAAFILKGLLRPKSSANFEMARRMNQDMNFDHQMATQDFAYSPRRFHPKF